MGGRMGRDSQDSQSQKVKKKKVMDGFVDSNSMNKVTIYYGLLYIFFPSYVKIYIFLPSFSKHFRQRFTLIP